MAEFQGNRISELKDPRCWRLCHVQTSGCMATERRTDEQREQQQIVLDYVTDGGCDVVGLGDTRLGDDATEVCRMARGIEGRARGEALMRTLEGLDARQRAAALAARTGVTRVHWQSAGSHKYESDIWRGGVALGSYGDAAAREFGAINDARGWGSCHTHFPLLPLPAPPFTLPFHDIAALPWWEDRRALDCAMVRMARSCCR